MGRYRHAFRPAVADRLARLVDAGQAGQPYLFTGPQGCGKEATALEIARRANCVQPDRCTAEQPCESCAKADTFQHPDIRWIGPAPATLDLAGVRELLAAKTEDPFHQPDYAATSQVLIGDPEDPGPLSVRSLIQFLRRQAFQGRWKVAIVADAQRLNPSAANAFLKTLEEPPPRSLIILTATTTAGMLPTILSRCQRIAFEPYAEAELTAILRRLAPEQADEVEAAARLADGNARRAMALLGPDARALWHWSVRIFTALGEGRAADALVASEQLHGGFLPAVGPDGEVQVRAGETKDLARKRQRAILLCEMLAQLHAEAVACRERGDDWRPRDPQAEALVRRVAAARTTASLLADIVRLEVARADIDGNLNLGLCTAALLQDLSDHVRHDAPAAR